MVPRRIGLYDYWEDSSQACTFYVPMTKLFVAHLRITLELAPSSFDSLERLDESGPGVPLFTKCELALLMLHVGGKRAASDASCGAPTWNQAAPAAARAQSLPVRRDPHDRSVGPEQGILKIEFKKEYWQLLLCSPLLLQRGFRAAPHWLLKCKLPLQHPDIRCSLSFGRLSTEILTEKQVGLLDIELKLRQNEKDIQTLEARGASIRESRAGLETILKQNEVVIAAASAALAKQV